MNLKCYGISREMKTAETYCWNHTSTKTITFDFGNEQTVKMAWISANEIRQKSSQINRFKAVARIFSIKMTAELNLCMPLKYFVGEKKNYLKLEWLKHD